MNEKREEFTLEKIKSIIRDNKDLKAKELCDKIKSEVERFVGAAPQHDDQSLVLLKVVT